VTQDLTAKNNEQSIDQTIKALNDNTRGLIFSNLVDFDMLYGHRRDTEGYAPRAGAFRCALAGD
jgi:phosphopentomutase